MRLIAHRGNLYGPDYAHENSPEHIEFALSQGFNAEVDVWYRKDKDEWWTGHDSPQYKVTLDWLKNVNFWLHCKNWEALEQLSFMSPQLHYFWHDTDEYTLTSAGVPWVYPKKSLFKTSVCVMPEIFMDIKDTKKLDVYGFCSDYIADIKEIIE